MKLPKLSLGGVKAFYPRQFKLDFHMYAFYVWGSDLFGVFFRYLWKSRVYNVILKSVRVFFGTFPFYWTWRVLHAKMRL